MTSFGSAMKELVDRQSGDTAVIIGAGSTLLDFRDKITRLVSDDNVFNIGINNMTSVVVPTYHLWTNSGRLRQYAGCIHPKSTVLFGSQLKKKLIKSCYKGNYFTVNYTDKAGTKISYKKGCIRGHYRTAGCLSIMVAHLMGARKIYIAGMDGYTFLSSSALKSGKSQHLYGTGFTDNNNWKICQKKDDTVYKILMNLKKFGISFSIITPTVFSEFYRGGII